MPVGGGAGTYPLRSVSKHYLSFCSGSTGSEADGDRRQSRPLGAHRDGELERRQEVTEAKKPPAFPEGLIHKSAQGDQPRTVDHVFWLQPGHATEKECGTPGRRRRVCSAAMTTASHGKAWTASTGTRSGMIGAVPKSKLLRMGRVHSINVDPRDARHLYIGTTFGVARVDGSRRAVDVRHRPR